MEPEIVFSDNETPFVEEWINPLVGYQPIHKRTGRILPTCNRFEIFTWNAMVEKFEAVNEMFKEIDTTEYWFEPIYQTEIEEMHGGYLIRMSNKDFLGI